MTPGEPKTGAATVSPLRASIAVPATPRGAVMARHITAAALDGWGLQILSDDSQLVVAELVTNALRHAPGSDIFELELHHYDDGIRITVTDGSALRPVIRELQHTEPTGRGMRIVESLVTRWGAEDHHTGKKVWAEIDTPHV